MQNGSLITIHIITLRVGAHNMHTYYTFKRHTCTYLNFTCQIMMPWQLVSVVPFASIFECLECLPPPTIYARSCHA